MQSNYLGVGEGNSPGSDIVVTTLTACVSGVISVGITKPVLMTNCLHIERKVNLRGIVFHVESFTNTVRSLCIHMPLPLTLLLREAYIYALMNN